MLSCREMIFFTVILTCDESQHISTLLSACHLLETSVGNATGGLVFGKILRILCKFFPDLCITEDNNQ